MRREALEVSRVGWYGFPVDVEDGSVFLAAVSVLIFDYASPLISILRGRGRQIGLDRISHGRAGTEQVSASHMCDTRARGVLGRGCAACSGSRIANRGVVGVSLTSIAVITGDEGVPRHTNGVDLSFGIRIPTDLVGGG